LEIIIRAESPVRYVCHFEKVARWLSINEAVVMSWPSQLMTIVLP
jgi:hypothetical protein